MGLVLNLLAYMVVGALWCLTIIGIPFGIASFRIGLFALWPFGRTVVAKPGAGVGSGIGNVFWFVLSGVWLAHADSRTQGLAEARISDGRRTALVC